MCVLGGMGLRRSAASVKGCTTANNDDGSAIGPQQIRAIPANEEDRRDNGGGGSLHSSYQMTSIFLVLVAFGVLSVKRSISERARDV